jgi:hypothetical protein
MLSDYQICVSLLYTKASTKGKKIVVKFQVDSTGKELTNCSSVFRYLHDETCVFKMRKLKE